MKKKTVPLGDTSKPAAKDLDRMAKITPEDIERMKLSVRKYGNKLLQDIIEAEALPPEDEAPADA